jgi:predicted enzyme related to lactoylglutathione lyase
MTASLPEPLFKKVDCVRVAVPDLEAGLAFYREQLGHTLNWRSATSAGLRMPDSDAEVVIQTEDPGVEVDFLVVDADAAAERFVAAGGQVVVPPFDIPIGRCVVVRDPWDNQYVLLDMSQGPLRVDAAGNVVAQSATNTGNP